MLFLPVNGVLMSGIIYTNGVYEFRLKLLQNNIFEISISMHELNAFQLKDEITFSISQALIVKKHTYIFDLNNSVAKNKLEDLIFRGQLPNYDSIRLTNKYPEKKDLKETLNKYNKKLQKDGITLTEVEIINVDFPPLHRDLANSYSMSLHYAKALKHTTMRVSAPLGIFQKLGI